MADRSCKCCYYFLFVIVIQFCVIGECPTGLCLPPFAVSSVHADCSSKFCKPKSSVFCSYNRQLNCKNSAQNALDVDILRSKVKKNSRGGGHCPFPDPSPMERGHPSPHPIPLGGTPPPHTPLPSAPRSSRLRRSTLPPFANPGSATDNYT